MSLGGRFIADKHNKELRWATLNRDSGAKIKVSEPLVALIDGAEERFSLVPSSSEPWFEYVDRDRGCVLGHLHNYPTANPAKLFRTEPLVSVITKDGVEISTLLALLPTPMLQIERNRQAKLRGGRLDLR